MSSNGRQTYYSFYFKRCYTSAKQIWRFDKNMSMYDFIEQVKMKAYNEFNIERTNSIEIIEIGLFPNEDDIQNLEEKYCLVPYNETLKERYQKKHKNVSFYIRVL
jgi:hypothetical protein